MSLSSHAKWTEHWGLATPETAAVFASFFSIGVPVKPMNDAFNEESLELLAKGLDSNKRSYFG